MNALNFGSWGTFSKFSGIFYNFYDTVMECKSSLNLNPLESNEILTIYERKCYLKKYSKTLWHLWFKTYAVYVVSEQQWYNLKTSLSYKGMHGFKQNHFQVIDGLCPHTKKQMQCLEAVYKLID